MAKKKCPGSGIRSGGTGQKRGTGKGKGPRNDGTGPGGGRNSKRRPGRGRRL